MRTLESLKKLALKCTDTESITDVPGNTVDEVISYIEDNFNVNGADGQDGADGKSVTAIALTTTDGAVTGGTCTFSDGSSAAITVTEAPGE